MKPSLNQGSLWTPTDHIQSHALPVKIDKSTSRLSIIQNRSQIKVRSKIESSLQIHADSRKHDVSQISMASGESRDVSIACDIRANDINQAGGINLRKQFRQKIIRSIPCLYVEPKFRSKISKESICQHADLFIYFHANAEDLISTVSFLKYLGALTQVVCSLLGTDTWS